MINPSVDVAGGRRSADISQMKEHVDDYQQTRRNTKKPRQAVLQHGLSPLLVVQEVGPSASVAKSWLLSPCPTDACHPCVCRRDIRCVAVHASGRCPAA